MDSKVKEYILGAIEYISISPISQVNIDEATSLINLACEYIKTNNLVFNSVNEMINYNLNVGDKVRTLGYYLENDKGAADYEIMSYEQWYDELPVDLKALAYRTDQLGNPVWSKTVVDEYGNHTLKNGLVAKIIQGEVITPEQWGCIGDGLTDNTEQLIHLFANTKSGYIKFSENSTYLMKSRSLNRKGYSNNEYIWLMCGAFISGAAHGKPVMANINNVILDGNGSTIEIAENDYCKDTNDFGVFEFGGIINGLEIKNFKFNGNGLTQLNYTNSNGELVNMRTTNHTIFYSIGNMNAVQLTNGSGEIKPDIPYKNEVQEISNVNIHYNNFTNSGTGVNLSDGGGDFILFINPTKSENVFIEDNYFEDWGRWVFSVDLGGSGERFYNYKFNRNICIQTDNNKLSDNRFRGLGWIDFEARKCWTELEVCDNKVNGLTGWAFNGNGKISNNISVNNNNLIRNIDRNYRSAYPYAFEWYSVYTKDFVFDNNNISSGTMKLGLTLDKATISNNIISNTSIAIYGIYGDITIDNNTTDQDQLIRLVSVNLPYYITDINNEGYITEENRKCNFLFTNNNGGIEGGKGNSAKIFDPSYPGKYSYINLIIKDNKLKKLNLIAWDAKDFEFDPSQLVDNIIFSARGAKFINKSYSKSVNNPVVGGGTWINGEIATSNISIITRIESSPYYKGLNFKLGNSLKVISDGYLPMNGEFLMADSDLSYYYGMTVKKYNHIYTDSNLYIACSDGTLGDKPSHIEGKEISGDVELLWLVSLADLEVITS